MVSLASLHVVLVIREPSQAGVGGAKTGQSEIREEREGGKKEKKKDHRREKVVGLCRGTERTSQADRDRPSQIDKNTQQHAHAAKREDGDELEVRMELFLSEKAESGLGT